MNADATASAFLFSDHYTLICGSTFPSMPVDEAHRAEKKCVCFVEARSVAVKFFQRKKPATRHKNLIGRASIMLHICEHTGNVLIARSMPTVLRHLG